MSSRVGLRMCVGLGWQATEWANFQGKYSADVLEKSVGAFALSQHDVGWRM